MVAGNPPGVTTAFGLVVDWLAATFASVRQSGWRGLVASFLGAAVGVAVALSLPQEYTAGGAFIARGSSTSLLPSALQGIAATVGLAGARDYSPQFYADLLMSDPVLIAALGRQYEVPGQYSSERRTYLEIEHVTGKNAAAQLEAAVRHLRKHASSRADVRTNIVSLSVTTRYPSLSRDLAAALLEALDSMNISFRQQQSRELREFFEGRMADAQRGLDSAETALRMFLERNRVTQGSPLLTFEEMRLTRAADLKRSVYTTVVQQYEEAKIQEARNVPVLTVLTPPAAPTRRSGPPRRLIVVLGIVLGICALRVPRILSAFRTRVRAEVAGRVERV